MFVERIKALTTMPDSQEVAIVMIIYENWLLICHEGVWQESVIKVSHMSLFPV